GKKNRRADVYRLTPERREQFTLDLYVLHPLGVCRHGDRRKHARERQLEVQRVACANVYALHVAHEISRRRVPVLPLPPVHVSPDDVSIRAMELCVHVHHRLYVVISSGKLCEREWISGRRRVDRCARSRSECRHVQSEERLRSAVSTRTKARLGSRVAGDDEDQASGDRRRMHARWEGDFNALRGQLRRWSQDAYGQQGDCTESSCQTE